MSHDHDDDALRPNPDALLARMQRETAVARRGRLKVFIGMCPGVGKTYAMLQAAQARQRGGEEVLVGIVETHGRTETEALLAGLAIAPRAQFEYKGATLNELDLDAILLWHPPVVIVDELAHTNAPGSRHPKRYQDVRELLDAGIDVFTTVNVQHLESRADTVYQITGVPVRETVPDSVLDLADEIVLVDLTPAQLRARLAEGKVYLGGARAAAAAENFFKESNLTALREMALRYVAEHVDRDLRDLMRSEAIAGPWKTGDRLLVAISASPFSEKLIRYTRRLAATMEGSWIAAFIDTGQALDEPAQARLARHLTLARQLGAEVVSVPGTDVGETLLALARQHNVTQIVLGKPLGSRWRHWLTARASPVDWLIRHSGEIDIHMIRPEGEARGPRASLHFGSSRTGPREYVAATVVAGVVTGVCLLLSPFTGYWTIALIYLLAVVLASTRLGRGAMFYLAALSALLWDFLFIPPLYTFYIREVPDFVMLGTYFVVALVTGQFTTRLRERERAERWRQERATALYRLTRALAAGRSLDESLATAAELLKNSFGAEVAFWLRDTAGIAPHRASTFALDAKDESVAAWAFQKKQPAGRFTDTLPDAAALHLPLVAGQHAAGVLSLRLTGGALNLEQRELLDAFAAQLAVFLEKERAVEATRAAQLAAQSERLQKTLFDSVSHELKTPLTALAAALEQAEPDRSELQQAVRRLTRTVDHLLDVTRLESGLLRPAREWIDPGELAREAIGLARLDARAVTIHAPPQMAPVFVDAGLIEQALVVLLSNAENYAPIELSIRNENGAILFQVEDRGPGLAAGEEQKVFEKFYRGASQRTGGLGLGLAIAKGLVEAHGGTITAANRADGRGARFSIRLPLGAPMQLPADISSEPAA